MRVGCIVSAMCACECACVYEDEWEEEDAEVEVKRACGGGAGDQYVIARGDASDDI